jgi:uncharacterized membrane protein YfcA
MDISTSDESNNVKKYLVGVRVWSWVAIGLTAIILTISALILIWTLRKMSILPPSNDVIYPPFLIPGSVFGISVGAIIIALYLIAIFGINNKKTFSVKLVRTLLILTMFSFPIGTIIGAVLLRRINNPMVKKYFNYIK